MHDGVVRRNHCSVCEVDSEDEGNDPTKEQCGDKGDTDDDSELEKSEEGGEYSDSAKDEGSDDQGTTPSGSSDSGEEKEISGDEKQISYSDDDNCQKTVMQRNVWRRSGPVFGVPESFRS